MPAAEPPEFRRRAIELARRRKKPISAIAHVLGIAQLCLRNWMHQDDVDASRDAPDIRASHSPTSATAIYSLRSTNRQG